MRILDDDKNYCPFCEECFGKDFELESHLETEHYDDVYYLGTDI